MNDSNGPPGLIHILVIAAGIVLLSLLCRPADPNTELAKTAREAVEMARDSESAVTSAVLWTDRFRLLAIVIGMSVPVVVVYLISRSSSQAEPDTTEILQQLEQLGVSSLDTLRSTIPAPKQLPSTEEADQNTPPRA
ncbi:MAG: hypothetical protein ACE5GE_16055 [Phycisphaerae bacterium]